MMTAETDSNTEQQDHARSTEDLEATSSMRRKRSVTRRHSPNSADSIIAANSSGTVFFSAPLFRPNLHYQVLPKPSSSKAAMEKMGDWIQKHHPCVIEIYAPSASLIVASGPRAVSSTASARR